MSAKCRRWTKEEDAELLRLVKTGEYLNIELATIFDRKPVGITFRLKKLGIKNQAAKKIFGTWNAKHKHLREPVMRYFLSHTREECCAKFGLSERELKSLFTVGYRLPEFRHLRKETRRHDAWTAREFRFLLAHAGLMPREWIAKKLNRGSALGIKDRLDLLGVGSQNLNGLTISKFRILFGQEPAFFLQTKAGPTRGFNNPNNPPSYYKIIPWVWMEDQIQKNKLEAPEMYRTVISTMAMFQEWIHAGNALAKMKKIVKQPLEGK